MLLAISSGLFYRPTSSQFIWLPWSIHPSSTYSYFLEAWMSQKKKMIHQLGEIWKLEESHPVSKTLELRDCSHWKVRGFPWLKTFGQLATVLWPHKKDRTDWARWFTSDNILCLLPLAVHSDLIKPKLFSLSLMTLELAQKIPTAFPPNGCHSQSLASLLCRVRLELQVLCIATSTVLGK